MQSNRISIWISQIIRYLPDIPCISISQTIERKIIAWWGLSLFCILYFNFFYSFSPISFLSSRNRFDEINNLQQLLSNTNSSICRNAQWNNNHNITETVWSQNCQFCQRNLWSLIFEWWDQFIELESKIQFIFFFISLHSWVIPSSSSFRDHQKHHFTSSFSLCFSFSSSSFRFSTAFSLLRRSRRSATSQYFRFFFFWITTSYFFFFYWFHSCSTIQTEGKQAIHSYSSSLCSTSFWFDSSSFFLLITRFSFFIS